MMDDEFDLEDIDLYPDVEDEEGDLVDLDDDEDDESDDWLNSTMEDEDE